MFVKSVPPETLCWKRVLKCPRQVLCNKLHQRMLFFKSSNNVICQKQNLFLKAVDFLLVQFFMCIFKQLSCLICNQLSRRSYLSLKYKQNVPFARPALFTISDMVVFAKPLSVNNSYAVLKQCILLSFLIGFCLSHFHSPGIS